MQLKHVIFLLRQVNNRREVTPAFTFMCFRRELGCVYDLSHTLQMYGLSDVCTCMCFFLSLLLAKRLSQPSNSHLNGFSPAGLNTHTYRELPPLPTQTNSHSSTICKAAARRCKLSTASRCNLHFRGHMDAASLLHTRSVRLYLFKRPVPSYYHWPDLCVCPCVVNSESTGYICTPPWLHKARITNTARSGFILILYDPQKAQESLFSSRSHAAKL